MPAQKRYRHGQSVHRCLVVGREPSMHIACRRLSPTPHAQKPGNRHQGPALPCTDCIFYIIPATSCMLPAFSSTSKSVTRRRSLGGRGKDIVSTPSRGANLQGPGRTSPLRIFVSKPGEDQQWPSSNWLAWLIYAALSDPKICIHSRPGSLAEIPHVVNILFAFSC